jgi:hypothetical protein
MTTFRSVTASHHGISYVLKKKLGSTMPTAEFTIKIACDLRELSNNPYSTDHREIAAELSAEIISIPGQINLQIIYQQRNKTFKNEYKNTNH